MADLTQLELPNGTTYDLRDDLAVANITRSSNTFTATRRDGTTFTFTQKDNNTTYTLGVDGNDVTLTPSSGSVQNITVPYATTAGTATDNTKIPLFTSGGIASCFANNSTNKWYLIATINITSTYINRPVIFELSGRGQEFTVLEIQFESKNNLDPPLAYIHTNGYTDYYIKKADTSTWEVYGYYHGTYGAAVLHRISGYGASIGITVNMTNYGATAPTDLTQATYGWNCNYANSAGSATNDSDGNAINSTYLKLAGGTMTGPLKFASGSIPAFSESPTYLLGIEAFADGGDVKWQNVSKISVGNATIATQDGDGNTITSTYLPLAGGIMSGTLIAKPSQYEDSYSGALNMSNSNIYGVNSIYTADESGNAAEGIHFYRDATHVDTLWMNGGDLLFVPNRELGTSTSKANSQKVGRFTANPTSGQVVITDGTTGGMKSSGYTIAKSVPFDAVFTDTDHTYSLTSTNDSLQIATGTSGDNTIWDVSVVTVNGHTVNKDVPSDAVFTDTDTKVTVSNTNPTSGTWYYPVWYTGTSGTGGVHANDGFRYYSLQGTAETDGSSYLTIGNATASGTAGNKAGYLRIYGKNTRYAQIVAPEAASANRTHTFPNASGIILNTGTTSFTQSLSSGTKIGTIKINGTSTDIYCETNTDANVAQFSSADDNAYEVLFSGTTDTTSKTEYTRKASEFLFNPGTSTLLIGSTTANNIQITSTDISNSYKWDGTNTSLKTALSKKLGNTGSQTITNGSIYISTSTITTGVGFFAKNRNNIQCYLYCGDDSMGLYSDNGHGGIIRKFLSTNEVAINGAVYSVANPANFRSAIGAAASSSRLTKKNIEDITEAEAKKILDIDVKSFDYKDAYILEGYPKRDKYYGVIAEDVLKQIPFVVNVPDDYDESKVDESKGLTQSLLTVDYDKFVPYLIKMVQIQQKEINNLKQQINKTTN